VDLEATTFCEEHPASGGALVKAHRALSGSKGCGIVQLFGGTTVVR
jgi:hypothetical protein